jgi:hypothetical protein
VRRWLALPPQAYAAPVCGGCVGGFWLEQAHADQPPAVIDTVDRVSVQLELAHDGGREVNPTGVQLGKSDRLIAGPAQSLKHSLLLGVSERHRLDCRGVKGLNVHLLERRDQRPAGHFAAAWLLKLPPSSNQHSTSNSSRRRSLAASYEINRPPDRVRRFARLLLRARAQVKAAEPRQALAGFGERPHPT